MSTTNEFYQQLERMRPVLVRFAGQSSLRTYVTGIFKYKIIDTLRLAKRECSSVSENEQSEDDMMDALFLSNGHTRDVPRAWENPDATFEQKDFFKEMEMCLEKLPAKTPRIF